MVVKEGCVWWLRRAVCVVKEGCVVVEEGCVWWLRRAVCGG